MEIIFGHILHHTEVLLNLVNSTPSKELESAKIVIILLLGIIIYHYVKSSKK